MIHLVLPRLWVSKNEDVNIDFIKLHNIKYIVNFSLTAPNEQIGVTYLNVPLMGNNFSEKSVFLKLDQLYDTVIDFMVLGYQKQVGILLHGDDIYIPFIFSAAFIINKLRITFDDLIFYFEMIDAEVSEKMLSEESLIIYAKKFNNHSCFGY